MNHATRQMIRIVTRQSMIYMIPVLIFFLPLVLLHMVTINQSANLFTLNVLFGLFFIGLGFYMDLGPENTAIFFAQGIYPIVQTFLYWPKSPWLPEMILPFVFMGVFFLVFKHTAMRGWIEKQR